MRVKFSVDPNGWSPVVSLYRYFTWSETMRVKFHELASDLLEGKPPVPEVEWQDPTIQEIFAYMSFWYGALFVVIEGWKQLRLKDGPVELLLSFTNVDLLKRYRNGTFHFQRHYFDSRLVAFVELGADNYVWADVLSDKLGDYFDRWHAAHTPDG